MALPARVTQEWIETIGEISPHQSSDGLVILEELFAEYWRAYEQHMPRRDIFDLAADKTIRFTAWGTLL